MTKRLSDKDKQASAKKHIEERDRKDIKEGRPSIYTQELAELICERIATSPFGIFKLCKMYKDMPAEHTIRMWEWRNPDFSRMCTLARQYKQMLLVESCEEKAEEVSTYVDPQGNVRVDTGSVSLQKLKIDHIHWQAVRLDKKNFGDKSTDEKLDAHKDEIKAEIQSLKADLDKKNKKEY